MVVELQVGVSRVVPQATFSVTNVVTYGELAVATPINLDFVARIPHSRAMGRFPAVTWRGKWATFILYKNGKVVATGLKSVGSVQNAEEELGRVLRDYAINFSGKVQLSVTNINATACIGTSFSLEQFARSIPNTVYDPEIFPGAITRNFANFGGCILLFSNSKVVLSGYKSLGVIAKVVDFLCDVLRSFGNSA